MLVIRLSRHGRKKCPMYRLVLQERDWAPSSKAIENLGHMDPHTDPATVVLKEERIKYWLAQGAQASSTVHNILINAGIIKDAKKRSVFGKKKKTEEELAAETEAAKLAKSKPKEEPKDEKTEVKEEKVEEKIEIENKSKEDTK